MTRFRPSPTRPSDFESVEWARSPTTTWISGAPNSPSDWNVPAQSGEQRVPCGGEARGVGDRRAGDEGDPGVGGEVQEIDEPTARRRRAAWRPPATSRAAPRSGPTCSPATSCQGRPGTWHRSRSRSNDGRRRPSSPGSRRRATGGASPTRRRRRRAAARRRRRARPAPGCRARPDAPSTDVAYSRAMPLAARSSSSIGSACGVRRRSRRTCRRCRSRDGAARSPRHGPHRRTPSRATVRGGR